MLISVAEMWEKVSKESNYNISYEKFIDEIKERRLLYLPKLNSDGRAKYTSSKQDFIRTLETFSRGCYIDTYHSINNTLRIVNGQVRIVLRPEMNGRGHGVWCDLQDAFFIEDDNEKFSLGRYVINKALNQDDIKKVLAYASKDNSVYK